MAGASFDDPGLTLGLAMAAGVAAQALARHLAIPGIVLLLATGLLLGPELAGLVRPQALGPALQVVVGFGVAVILFEGGLNLQLRRLRHEARVIRRLVTIGAGVTLVVGSAAAAFLMGWEWRTAALFGSLVVVTGPTVVTPLVRRIGLARQVRTILEAEGVFVDAVGAIVAVVALEIAVGQTADPLAQGASGLGLRFGTGLLVGAAGGAVIALPLRWKRVVPEGLENVFTLSLVLALFQVSNALAEESGILAAIVAGLVVGNAPSPSRLSLFEFKEQLTTMLVGMLFVLLAADVPLRTVAALGARGWLVVLVLVLAARPLAVLLSAAGADIGWREKVFLSWLAPRGIVAAAVSSLFAETLGRAGIPGGGELRALVFLVIGVTVVVQGLSAGSVAGLLGLRRPSDSGWVILGAGPLGRAVGAALQAEGEEVLFVEADAPAVRKAEAGGFKVVFGDQLERRTIQRTDPEIRRGYLALTSFDGVNLLFARRVREEFRRRVLVAVHRGRVGVTPENVREFGGGVLFGRPRELDGWASRLESGEVDLERWSAGRVEADAARAEGFPDPVLPLAVVRGRVVEPVDEAVRFQEGDQLLCAVRRERGAEGREWLESRGWSRVGALPGAAPERPGRREA